MISDSKVEQVLKQEEERFVKEHPKSKALFEANKKNYLGKSIDL